MAAVPLKPPFYPVIYVRGYAGTQQDVEDTVADPFMGFNLGSSKIRQLWTGKVERYYFDSPFLRLMQDFGYTASFQGGADMPLVASLCKPRTVFIYRYYDATSSDFGDNHRLTIEEAANGLSELILRIRQLFCDGDPAALNNFKVILVAHSMGGLICRCLLQNSMVSSADARQAVDKVFTYATPHNGIDFELIGNVPGFLTLSDANNFNRQRIAQYLQLPSSDDVSSLDGKFDPQRVFNLVGTNDKDYEVAATLSRRLAGPMSDGLVRIKNATTWGRPVGSLANSAEVVNSPRAFVYRSHSGYYGIVNSEEGYQNMRRFLFGAIRVTGTLHVDSITLPADVEQQRAAGRQIRASYQIEVVLRVRGQPWDLHRRLTTENSAIFRTYDELVDSPKAVARRDPTLFSLFLSDRKEDQSDPNDPSLGFSLDLGIQVPEYDVDGILWTRNRYAGGYLFRHKFNFEATPPSPGNSDNPGNPNWIVRYGIDQNSPNDADTLLPLTPLADGAGVTFTLPVVQSTMPGIQANMVLEATRWQ